MPTIRIGYGSDFSIDSNGVGIGTSFAASNTKLDVVGALKGDFNITGVTTLTAYGGFVAQQQHVNKASTIGFATVGLQTFAGLGTVSQYYETDTGFTDLGGVHHGDDQRFNTLSEDLIIDDGQILNITKTDMVGVTTIGEYDPHTHASYVCAGSLEQVSVTGHFSVPNGGSNDRQLSPIEGTVRFNDDLNTLEFFNGSEWKQFTYNQGQSGRALFGGGTSPGPSTRVDWIETLQILTLGNTQDFGDLTQHREALGGGASSVRGVFSGGLQSAPLNRDEIDYVTIASSGNALDFGNITDSGRRVQGSVSSSTRAVNLGGYKDSISQNVNIMDYIEIATTGDALEFGDITTKRRAGGSCSSPTRGIYAGGFGSVAEKIIEYLNIASKGNTVRFGELINAGYSQMGFSNGVRGIMGGGNQDGSASGNRTFIASITIASEGNAIHFGDLTVARDHGAAESNLIRGVFAGGQSGPTRVNVIDYFSISTGGDALDFGDLSAGIRKGCSGLSDSHGGLGGF